jgi:hypothetical protein
LEYDEAEAVMASFSKNEPLTEKEYRSWLCWQIFGRRRISKEPFKRFIEENESRKHVALTELRETIKDVANSSPAGSRADKC